jgi:hypothetical protein
MPCHAKPTCSVCLAARRFPPRVKGKVRGDVISVLGIQRCASPCVEVLGWMHSLSLRQARRLSPMHEACSASQSGPLHRAGGVAGQRVLRQFDFTLIRRRIEKGKYYWQQHQVPRSEEGAIGGGPRRKGKYRGAICQCHVCQFYRQQHQARGRPRTRWAEGGAGAGSQHHKAGARG